MARTSWLCPCGHRNEPTHRKCRGEGCERAKRKKRRAKHSELLRGDTYPIFVKANEEIHYVSDESCGVCGKPRSQERRHDRDHDHKTGHARGLACPGNTGCNVLMLPWITANVARSISGAMYAEGRAQEGARYALIGAYLERVENHYARETQ